MCVCVCVYIHIHIYIYIYIYIGLPCIGLFVFEVYKTYRLIKIS